MMQTENLQMPLPSVDLKAVRALRFFSTGRGFQHKEHRQGSWLPQLWWVLTSRSWVGLPISVFLIEHKDGLVLLDTGLDPAIKTRPKYITQAIGRFLLNRIFQFDIHPSDKLGAKLKATGINPGDIKKAIIPICISIISAGYRTFRRPNCLSAK